MLVLRKYYKATSIIESVIALTIISICIYIAIMVYANVFSPKTSIKHYSHQNEINEQFYLMQLQDENKLENIETTENWLNTYLKEVTLTYTDSLSSNVTKTVYIHTDEE